MNSWKHENLKILAACLISTSLFLLPAYADGDFYGFEEIYPDLSLSNNSSHTNAILQGNFPSPSEYKIYLDSSKVQHPVLKGVFPSPSEYKTKNRIPADIFSPTDNQKVLNRTYKVENNENTTELVTVETLETNKEEPFENLNFFTPPSEYQKPQKEIKVSSSPQETELTAEDDSSYHAQIESSNEEPNVDYEGKVITNINIDGLKLVNENTVLNVINSRNGSLFNAERIQQDLQSIYALGYFTDSMYVEPSLNDDDTVNITIAVNENPEIKEVQITGNTIFTTNELMLFTKNLVGMPQNLNMINRSIEEINKHYAEQGYILANVNSVDDNRDGALILGINEGVIDNITFEGAKKTKDYVIRRNIMTQPKSVYNEELLKKDLAKIYETQIFDEVNRKIEPSSENEGEYNVTIVVKEASSNSISIGGGLDNALGVFGSLRVTENNFLGNGQKLSLSGMLGSGLLLSDASIKNRMNYQIELDFFEPYFLNADNSLTSKIYLRELGSYKIPLAIERRFGFNGIIKHKIKNNDNLTANLGLGFENIHLREGDYNRIAQQYALRNMNFAMREKQLTGGNFINISPAIQYSKLDSEFMPREGLTAYAGFMESLAVDNVKHTSGRLMGGLTKYIPVFKKSTLMLGAKGGIKVHGSHMPEVMAFTLGGPYSVRGFRMSGVGAGESFLAGSVELQTPIPFMDRFKYDVLKNLRFAFFLDAGKIWDPTITSTLYDRPNSAITAGVGLRVNIPGIGPISVDYGLPLTNVGHYNKQHGYFTFGTGGLYDNNNW